MAQKKISRATEIVALAISKQFNFRGRKLQSVALSTIYALASYKDANYKYDEEEMKEILSVASFALAKEGIDPREIFIPNKKNLWEEITKTLNSLGVVKTTGEFLIIA